MNEQKEHYKQVPEGKWHQKELDGAATWNERGVFAVSHSGRKKRFGRQTEAESEGQIVAACRKNRELCARKVGLEKYSTNLYILWSTLIN